MNKTIKLLTLCVEGQKISINVKPNNINLVCLHFLSLAHTAGKNSILPSLPMLALSIIETKEREILLVFKEINLPLVPYVHAMLKKRQQGREVN